MSGIADAPVYALDRAPLAPRAVLDFDDYGFRIDASVTALFEIVPSVLTDEECFLFFFAHDDVRQGRWALFNLHVFLKRTDSLQDFAHGLGQSVHEIALAPMTPFGIAGLGYSRIVTIGDLFKGADQVVAFLGGDASWSVRDSHAYFRHHHAHAYSGMIHPPGEDADRRYDTLRAALFAGVHFAA